MERTTQRLIKAIYFQKIATQITRKSPESIRRKRSVVHVPDETAYNLACRHVANFLYNHGMEMSLYVASIETAGVIPKKALPQPVGKELSLSEHKNLYQQLKRAVRPPDLNALKPSRGFLKEHHHHHHHHSKRDLTPTEAYKETANMLAQRASYEIRSLGMDPNDPTTAQHLYDEFKEFLADKKRQKEAPQPSPYQVMQAPPPPVYQSDGTSQKKSSTKPKTPSEKSSYIEESYTGTKKSSASKSGTTTQRSTTAKSSTAKSSTAKSSTAQSSTAQTSKATSTTGKSSTEDETESSSKSDPEAEEEDEEEDHNGGHHGEEEEEEEEEDHGEEEGEGEEE